MNPFPANSVDDTDNRSPSEPSAFASSGGGGGVPDSADAGRPASSLANVNNVNTSSNTTTNHQDAPPSNATGGTGGRMKIIGIANNNNNNGNSNMKKETTATQAAKRRSRLRDMRDAFDPECTFVIRECVAVTIWASTVPLLSLCCIRLLEKAAHVTTWQQRGDVRWILGGLAWLLLRLLTPLHKLLGTTAAASSTSSSAATAAAAAVTVGSGGAPGFFLAHAWILNQIQRQFDLFPNLGCRICEWKLGRITNTHLLLAFGVHALIPCLLWGVLSLLSRECSLTNEASLFSLSYHSNGTNDNDSAGDDLVLWFFFKEVLANALFPVIVMVVPPLLKLNDFPEWLSIIALYPVYAMGVDANDRGSSLSPAAGMAQSILSWRLRSFDNWSLLHWRLVAQLLGNVLAGTIMQTMFPDEPVA